LRALLLAFLISCTRAPSTPVAPRHRVVMISIDGLRPDYLTSAARIPTLRSLVERGAHASVKSIWPTVTYPAHTTLVTGARPSKHGIANNLPFDPLGDNHEGWYWYARAIRVPTLWDEAHRHGYTTVTGQ
jgi:predicted AlkP superfamily pyrophosphatase or phosphodiesterase